MKWCVYILRCADNTLYTGVTTDLKKRLRQHNGEIVGGAKYTQNKRPAICVYQELVADRSTAQKREYVIKQLSREEKVLLIEGLAEKS